MDKYNRSHDKDLTPYKAFKRISRRTRKDARHFGDFIFGMAHIAGFDIIEPVRLRHKATGATLEVRAEEEDSPHAGNRR